MHDTNTTPPADSTPDLGRYAKHYDEASFWAKAKNLPRAAIGQVMEKALIARELLLDGGTPLWAKAALVGVLGYFVMPLDMVPDVVPVFGFADDLTMLTLVLANLDVLATDEVVARARERLPASLRRDGD
jgi:uncharacterized membrane protein YkvA (DUF1232 family)